MAFVHVREDDWPMLDVKRLENVLTLGYGQDEFSYKLYSVEENILASRDCCFYRRPNYPTY